MPVLRFKSRQGSNELPQLFTVPVHMPFGALRMAITITNQLAQPWLTIPGVLHASQ